MASMQQEGRPRAARVVAVASLVASAALAAGCAADASPSGSPAAGSYNIMVLGEFTQGTGVPTTPFPETEVGAEAAVNAINKAGGINGKKINLITCDTQGLPNGATNCANKAVSDGVIATVGSFDVYGTYQTTLGAHHIPDIGPFPTGPMLSNKDSYPLWGTNSYTAGTVGRLASEGIRNVSITITQNPGNAAIPSLLASLKKRYPALKVSVNAVPSTAVDMSPYVQIADQQKGIVLALPGTSLISFVTGWRDAGAKAPIATFPLYLTNSVLQRLGPKADGLQTVQAFLPPTDTANTAVAQFDKAMNAVNKTAVKGDQSEDAYISVLLFAALAKDKSHVTGQSITSALNSLNGQATSVDGLSLGLLPPIQFTTPDTADSPQTPRAFNPYVVFGKAQDDKIIAATGNFVNAYTTAPYRAH